MRNTTAKDRSIVSAAFPDFKGRKIGTRYEGSVMFYDLNWSGGTKNTYRAIRLSDGKTQPVPDLAPWANPIEGRETVIPDGFAIVELSYFCGSGPRATIHYGSNPALPPAQPCPVCGEHVSTNTLGCSEACDSAILRKRITA